MLINSSTNPFFNASCILCADNHTILHFVSTGKCDLSQKEIDHFISWTKDNKLHLNPSKCYSITFAFKEINPPQLSISDHVLNDVETVKLLEVILTADTKLKEHANTTVNYSGYSNDIVWNAYLTLTFST